MLINLEYGRTGLNIDFPTDRTTVIKPNYSQGLTNQANAVLKAIRAPIGKPPLQTLVGSNQTVGISVCDITRAMPHRTVLPVVLQELAHVATDRITIFIATGTHRGNTPDELISMLGEDIVGRYRIINHDAFDKSGLMQLGQTSKGIPIWLNRKWVAQDIHVTTGFVEPHFFAGFSGGPKMVAPGLAGFATTMRLHDAEMIRHPNARWGVTEGNPIHDSVREIAAKSGVDFSIDVTINQNREITHVFAGDLLAAHRAACQTAKQVAMVPVRQPFDIVVTTNSGYPLDQNLYQTVKGMSAAAQVVKRGGTILCASECSDGLPGHGEYSKILAEGRNPQELLQKICTPGHNRHDQWEVQIQAQIQLKANVYLKAGGLTEEQIYAAHLTPIQDIEAAMKQHLQASGPNSRICVLPQGPQTIPYLETIDR